MTEDQHTRLVIVVCALLTVILWIVGVAVSVMLGMWI